MINARTLPSFPEKLLLPEIFWNTGKFFQRMFRHCETRNIDRTMKCKKNFKTNKSLKHQRVPILYEKVSALWVKKQSRENHDKRPHPPIFSRKIIDTRKFLKHQKVPPANVLALWDKKHRQDREVQKKFKTKRSLKHQRVLLLYEKVSELWDKKHRQDREVQKKFKTKRSLKHQRVLLLYEKVSELWDKKHRQDRQVQKKFKTKRSLKHQRVPLLYAKNSALWVKKHRQDCEVQKNFRNQKVYETPKDSSTLLESFGTVSQKQSKENHDKRTHPPIFSRKIIATRSFMKNWKFPPSNASAPWDKKHRQDREVQKKISKPTSLWNTKGFLYSTRKIWHCDSKTVKRKSW